MLAHGMHSCLFTRIDIYKTLQVEDVHCLFSLLCREKDGGMIDGMEWLTIIKRNDHAFYRVDRNRIERRVRYVYLSVSCSSK